MLPTVTREALVGNEALWRVGSWLSSGGAFVRPVAADTDVGVDLFCESTEGAHPFLHFFVQVKGGESQIEMAADSSKAAFDFEVKHLEYWRRQPVPVFVFLAPGKSPDRVFCVNVTLWSANNALPEGKTKRIWSDSVHCLTAEDAQGFLHQALPITYTINLCRLYGFIASIPQVSEAYERKEFTGYQAAFAENVVEQIRHTASWTLLDVLARGGSGEEMTRRAELLAGVIEAFDEVYFSVEQHRHYEDYRALGRWYHRKGDDAEARVRLLQSKRTIEEDANLRDGTGKLIGAWPSIVGALDAEIACLDVKAPHKH